MKNKLFRMMLIFFFCTSILFPGQKMNEKDLAPRYQEWLKLVSYIIRPEERDVFLRLTNDRERDLFIETSWKQRDPTPGTPQNEYKDEHTRRFVHANQRYGRNTPREGWMTDQGRMYIILGEPASKEIFETSGIYPAEVWTYYGDKTKGLPTQFNLVFFQRSGAGEYKLYNPTSDGPAALIIDKQGLDLTNHQQLYQKIYELAPTLAGPSISLIPGQRSYNYMPSPRENIILADIFDSPKKNISSTYATHFLNYKGVVSTEYLTNYVESQTDVALIQDPILNINFLHFSISPSRVSIDYFNPNDQYYCNYQLNVSVRKAEKLIFQYSKDFPLYFDPDKVDMIKAKGIAIQDSFPLIEGTYQMSILIQNSVGKEFSVSEREILVPEPTGPPKLVSPVVGYGLQDYPPHLHVPFKVVDKQLLIDPKSTISLSEDIAFFFSVMNVTKDLWEKGKDIIMEGLKNNLFHKDEVGNIVVDLGGQLGTKVLLRADGTSVYITQDLYLAKKKYEDFKYSKSIYVIGSEQNYHLQVLFEILKMMNFEFADGCYHLSHGMIFLPEGKMKSREGTVIDADTIIKELIEMVKTEIISRGKIAESEMNKSAKDIAMAALKFFLLKFASSKDFVFYPEESVSLYGKTGPYLQYSYVRANRIIQKIKKKPSLDVNFGLLNKPEEISLIKLLKDYPDVLEQASLSYSPHILAEYTHQLASSFNLFYEKYRVIGESDEEMQNARLLLVRCFRDVMRNCLYMFGINTVNTM